VYTTFCDEVVLLVIASLRVEVVWFVVLSPEVLVLFAATHTNDEGTFAVKGILTVAPLQIVAVLALVTAGTGLTVTVTVCTGPTHPPVVAVGVTE
jgi:hypothetical protein